MPNTVPHDSNNVIYEGLRDPSGLQFVAKQAGTVTTDGGGVASAPMTVAGDGTTIAKESGGNLATVATAAGTPADSAYTSGSGSIIAVAKGIYTRLSSILTNTPSLGQTTMSGSSPVAIASDQSNLPINLKQVNGSSIALGQTTMSASLPVAIASDQSNVVVQGGFTQVAGAGTGTVTGVNTDFISAMDVSAYKALSIQLTGTFNLTLQIQFSNDNVNFSATQFVGTNNLTSANAGTSLNSVGLYLAPVLGRYLRVRCTIFSSNASLAGNLELYATPPVAPFVTQNAILLPTTSGGTTDNHYISLATTNATLVKNAAGQVYGWSVGNNSASADAYVKLYNSSSAPTAGSGTPLRTIYVPKASGRDFHTPLGIPFSAGIGFTITGALADSDTTATGATQVVLELDYK